MEFDPRDGTDERAIAGEVTSLREDHAALSDKHWLWDEFISRLLWRHDTPLLRCQIHS